MREATAEPESIDSMPEYRAWLTVPHLEVESDDAVRLLDALAQHDEDLGPVLCGTGMGTGLQVIVATDSDDEATAACELYAAVTDGLQRAGLGDRYPTAIELETVDGEDPAGRRG